ncbi:MAG TPA: hypothetical protein VFW64_12260 [Pseudonocardiaceae bacterium]|nr:hypothetical protein [Pseudonocardiaceae bacterium]
MAGLIEFTTADLAILQKFLKERDRVVANSMKRRVRAAAEPVAVAVRASAEGMGLNRAAGAVKVRTAYGLKTAKVAVTVDRKQAPYARPIDKGSKGAAGYNRHPVFADPSKERSEWTWVNQPVRAFFEDGIAVGVPAAEVELAKVITDIVGELA